MQDFSLNNLAIEISLPTLRQPEAGNRQQQDALNNHDFKASMETAVSKDSKPRTSEVVRPKAKQPEKKQNVEYDASMMAATMLNNTTPEQLNTDVQTEANADISGIAPVQTGEAAVDVLEGLQNEEGMLEVEALLQQGTEPTAENAEAWMPIDDSNTAQQDVQPVGPRLEEHPRPLENVNGMEMPEQPQDVTDLNKETVEVIGASQSDEALQTTQNQKDPNAPQADPAMADVISPADILNKIKVDGQQQAQGDMSQQGEEAQMPAAPVTDAVETDEVNLFETEQAADESPEVRNAQEDETAETETVDTSQQFKVETAANSVVKPLEARTEAAPVQTAPQPLTQTEESFFSRMVQEISTSSEAGKQEFSIDMHPEFFGEMNIRLSMTDNGLSAKISTADSGVNSLISQHLFKLEQSLKEQGIDIVELEVSVFESNDFKGSEHSQGGNTNAFNNGMSMGGQNGGRYYTGPVGDDNMPTDHVSAAIETLEGTQVTDNLTAMGSSIEFSA